MNLNDCKFLLKSVVILLFFCQFKYCSAQWKFNVETSTAILSESPSTAAKNVATGAGVVLTTAAVSACALGFWNPLGWVACGGLGIAGVVSSIVAPSYIAPDPRYNCSPEEYKNRANKLISLLKETERTKTNKFDIFKYLDSFCVNQCIYPTRISPIGGDRCRYDRVTDEVESQYYDIRKEILGSDVYEYNNKFNKY